MRGFSLIETLVAVVVLVTAIVGPLTLAERSINSSIYARDQVTASLLAEEAIEYLRSVRDGNEYTHRNWLSDLSDCVGQLCMVDTTPMQKQKVKDSFQQCKLKAPSLYGSPCAPVAYDKIHGLYGFKTVNFEDTRFVREVMITTIPRGNNSSDKEAKIEVTVRSQTGNFREHDVVVRDYIYDW